MDQDVTSLPYIANHSAQFCQILQALHQDSAPTLRLEGMYGSAYALLAYSLRKHASHHLKHVFICATTEEACCLRDDLSAFLSDSYVYNFSCDTTPSSMHRLERSLALEALFGEQPAYITISCEDLQCPVQRKYKLSRKGIILHRAQDISREEISNILEKESFVATHEVREPGFYRMSGGRIDIFSYAHSAPFRLTLWGNRIEKISFFSTDTQLSYTDTEQIKLLGESNTQIHHSKTQFLYTALPNNCCIWHMSTDLSQQEPYDFSKYPELYFKNPPNEAHAIHWKGAPQPKLQDFREMSLHLQNFQNKGYTLYLSVAQPVQGERLKGLLLHDAKDLSIHLLPFALQAGFVLHSERLLCYTAHELMGRTHISKQIVKSKHTKSLTLRRLEELQVGDFVTHIDYGVARFAGLHTLEKNEKKQEMLRLIFKDNDTLYVHIHALHKLSKYRDASATAPRLAKLGGVGWTKKKEKIKQKMARLVKELVQLYAQRKNLAGFAFSKDPFIEAAMISSFTYEDTPDQAEATQAVIQDMEAPYPMDRLICGDVGFGKTEVAMRAACKAVYGGKQVAVLVPTTVLAMQHYKNFAKRLNDFSIQVGVLHRFCTTIERKSLLQNIRKNTVGVLIGTSALLSEEIEFSNLGLLIIDEEQKFGVKLKERLKKQYVAIDVLSMTATPIPRTLHFSLTGARDISLMHTPPPHRQTISTTLQILNPQHIREALTMEIARGGQAFYVHRNIKELEKISITLESLLPHARIAVVHGKLKGNVLEKTMVDFVNKKYDILVSTNIIENGLDIEGVNTIIIQDAHFFGLADLHQMRGRVGRSNTKAYCYLLVPPLKDLSAEARKRLAAIETFSQVGDGYKIALKDLDIRGAGNLLGYEQSGFINELGFEAYQKLLEETVTSIAESKEHGALSSHNFVKTRKQCLLETDTELYFPQEYIPSPQQRIQFYKKLSEIKYSNILDDYVLELEDRFGKMPPPAQALIESAQLSIRARSLGFQKVTLKRTILRLFFDKNDESFLQGPIFQKILIFLKAHAKTSKLEEKQAEGCLMIFKVESLGHALCCIDTIQSQETNSNKN